MPLLARVAASFFMVVPDQEPLIFLDEHHGIGGDTFLTTREAELLSGCGLDGDIVLVTADDLCHTRLHLGDMGIHLGALGADGGIDIHEAIALCSYQLDGFLQDDLTVHTIREGGSIREVIANVTHVGSAKQRVTDGMYQHVGIAMSKQA